MTNPRQEALILISAEDIALLDSVLSRLARIEFLWLPDDLKACNALLDFWRTQIKEKCAE